MQTHKLLPLKNTPEREPDDNLQKVRTRLYRRSKYWPLTLGTTVLYNVRQVFVKILL